MKKVIGIIAIIIGCLILGHVFILSPSENILHQIYKLVNNYAAGIFILIGILLCFNRDSETKEKLSDIYDKLQRIEDHMCSLPKNSSQNTVSYMDKYYNHEQNHNTTNNTSPRQNSNQETSLSPLKENLDDPSLRRYRNESDKDYWRRVEKSKDSDDFMPWNN